jgi:hypothetical protein
MEFAAAPIEQDEGRHQRHAELLTCLLPDLVVDVQAQDVSPASKLSF